MPHNREKNVSQIRCTERDYEDPTQDTQCILRVRTEVLACMGEQLMIIKHVLPGISDRQHLARWTLS